MSEEDCSPTHTPPCKVCVLGGGSFGTALATVAARRNHEVVLYARDEVQVKGINENRRNPKMLSQFELLPNIRATSDVEDAIRGAKFIIHAIPVQNTPNFYAKHKDLIPADVPIVMTSKGIYVATNRLLCDEVPIVLGRDQPFAVLSGPSFAKELMLNYPTGVVAASKDLHVAKDVQHALSSETFRVYATDDVIGVEVGGALKNPYAIGAGAAEGLGYGVNTVALLVTRAISELRKLALAMGGKAETLAGLSGVGDLMLTAFGGQSRNKAVGIRLAKGETIQDIVNSMDEVAEGVPTASVAVLLAREKGLHLPILEGLAEVLEGKIGCREAIFNLMVSELRVED
eukprot:GILI01030077.1.p1 GENE.GILI01030077.1~~GILI01030077.1.p1  ORF type:complete len:366 (+),score=133.69 GILI01030077.1:68-1099(+)